MLALVANAIDHEEAPRGGDRRIGVELEGVGNLTLKWAVEFPTIAKLVDRQMFQATLKRSRLIRSNSFSDDRGVYLTPEEVSIGPNQGTLGKSHPAELVSSPHQLNTKGLEFLRDSMSKALTDSKSPMASHAHYTELRRANIHLPEGHGGGRAVSLLDGAEVQSAWGRARAKIGGNLQTTVGVCVERLCHDNEAIRRRVVELMAADPTKQKRLLGLLDAAKAGQEALAADQITLGASDDARHRLRLVLFMYLVGGLASQLKGSGYEKDVYGCNIKGYSSLVGCGLATANDALRTAIREKARNDAIDHGEMHFQPRADAIALRLLNAMVASVKKVAELKAHAGTLESAFVLEHIGQPGRSIQVVHERAPAIPCFVSNNKLYTLIEAREKASMMNLNMASFLNKERTAASLLGLIETALGT